MDLVQLDHLTRSTERFLESLVVEGLDQVVDRGEIECCDGVIVGGGEDHRWHRVGAHLAHDFEPGLPGHLDVEKNEIGLQLADGRDRRQSIVGSAHDLDVLLVREQVLDPLAGEPLVVSDQHTQRLAGSQRPASVLDSAVVRSSARVRNGITISATVPPVGDSERVRLCALPYSCSSRWRMLSSPTPPSHSPFPTVSTFDGPGPLSDTVITSRSTSLRAQIRIFPVPEVLSTPCLTAFSTRGWRMRLGTSASRASPPNWTSISSRP